MEFSFYILISIVCHQNVITMHVFSYIFCTSKHLADAAPPMKPLVYEPERGLQAALGAFLQDKVFIDEDDGMVKLVFIDATKR